MTDRHGLSDKLCHLALCLSPERDRDQRHVDTETNSKKERGWSTVQMTLARVCIVRARFGLASYLTTLVGYVVHTGTGTAATWPGTLESARARA